MLKPVFILVLGLFVFNTAFAQKDTTVYYMAASGKLVSAKDSGDFVIKVSPPAPNGNKKLFIVDGFYKNGDKLFTAASLSSSFPLRLQGVYTTFFRNGNKMSERNFDDGEMTGESTLYYPNGRLYDKISKEITLTDTLILFKECRDSTGKVLTTDGNGDWITYNQDFSRVIEQGKIVNGLRDSIWIIRRRSGNSFAMNFKNGKPVTDPGTGRIFTSVDVVPEFSGGIDALMRYLTKNLRYPAVARENNIQGRVIISFVVERDGSLTDVKVVKGIGSGCDEEALRVIKLCPPWKPGMQNGKPVRVAYSLPINFTLSGN